MSKAIIILEGPDGAGKTTLAKALHDKLPGSVVVHFGPPTDGDEVREFQSDLRLIHLESTHSVVIVDRLFYSAVVYGLALRDLGKEDRVQMGMHFDRFLSQHRVLAVDCYPSAEQTRFFNESAAKGQQLNGINIHEINNLYRLIFQFTTKLTYEDHYAYDRSKMSVDRAVSEILLPSQWIRR